MIFRKPLWRRSRQVYINVSCIGCFDADLSTQEGIDESGCMSGIYRNAEGNHSLCISGDDEDVGADSYCFSRDEHRETDSCNNSSV